MCGLGRHANRDYGELDGVGFSYWERFAIFLFQKVIIMLYSCELIRHFQTQSFKFTSAGLAVVYLGFWILFLGTISVSGPLCKSVDQMFV